MLAALFTVVTAVPGIETAEGSVVVLRNELYDCCSQARPQKPLNKHRNARGWRKQRMRTPPKKQIVPVAPARKWRDSLFGC
jgi:hypothetical protein